MTPIERRYKFLCEVMKKVSELDISADLQSRKRDIVLCRFIIMKKLRDEGYTYEQIGKVCGKNHSTVINDIAKLNAILQYPTLSDTELINTFNTFIDYADKQIEIQLSAYEFETLKSVLQKFLTIN